MDLKNFIFILLLVFANFILVSVGLSALPESMLLYEFIFAFIALFIVTRLIVMSIESEKGYGLFAFYFFINMLNTLIIFILTRSLLSVFATIVNMLGILFSVYRLREQKINEFFDDFVIDEDTKTLYENIVPEIIENSLADDIKITKDKIKVFAEPVLEENKDATKPEITKNKKESIKKELTKASTKSKHAKTMLVSSKRSKLYHKPDCSYAKKIPEEQRIYYKDSREARKNGKKAHKCR